MLNSCEIFLHNLLGPVKLGIILFPELRGLPMEQIMLETLVHYRLGVLLPFLENTGVKPENVFFDAHFHRLAEGEDVF